MDASGNEVWTYTYAGSANGDDHIFTGIFGADCNYCPRIVSVFFPATGIRVVLRKFEVKAVSEGEDAQGQVTVKCRRSVDLDEAGLAALSTHFGDAVVTATRDVTSEDSVASACAVADDLGGLDVVVANAGRGTYSPVVDHGVDEWRAILDLCLTGVFLTIKHAAPVTHDGGSIITIASLNATQPSAGMSAYCAAKAGVVMLTKVAAMELGARRIRVNSIAPGLVETNATSGFFAAATGAAAAAFAGAFAPLSAAAVGAEAFAGASSPPVETLPSWRKRSGSYRSIPSAAVRSSSICA